MKKRFCHECGSSAELDATYCEECGTELRPLAAASAPVAPVADAASDAAVAPQPRRGVSGRALAIAGGVVAALAVGGGAAWFLLAPKPASEAELRAAAEDWIKAPDMQRRDRPCVQNFDYRAAMVDINPSDTRTQQWLAPLVKAGIYLPPTEVQTGNPWQPTALSYQKGPEAPRFVVNGQLCAASQLQVVRLAFDPKNEIEVSGIRVQRGSVTLAWQDRVAWSQESPAKEVFDGRFREREIDAVWLRDQDKGAWRVGTAAEVVRLDREMRRQTQSGKDIGGGSGGFSLSGLFSNPFGGGASPEKTVEDFFRNVADGKTEEAAKMVEVDGQQGQDLVAMLATISMEAAAQDGIRNIESENLGGDDSLRSMRSRITYNNGRTETRALTLHKVDGRWLLVLGH